MKLIKVVCGIIYKDDYIFIAKRKKGKPNAGKWEFPGGKVEKNETSEECLVRELQEELGMTVIIKDKIGESNFVYPEYEINLVAFNCHHIFSTLNLTSHNKYKWVKTSELKIYDLTEADILLLKYL